MDTVLVALLPFALGTVYLAIAINPTIPFLRACYWWRLPSKTRPSVVERGLFALLGLTLMLAAGYVLLVSRP